MFDDCVIMAGGSGTRLWPASSSRLPKQFLPAAQSKTFFYMALERAFAVTGNKGSIIIITGKTHIDHVVKECAKFKSEDKKRVFVIGEPAAKNTAPAIACAMALSKTFEAKRNMLVLTSDHIIKPLPVFKKNASLAEKYAGPGKLVVFGIKPERPETGYGYIETKKNSNDGAYTVKAFHEKPDPVTAKKYTADKRFFWNSGMFAFNTEYMTDCFHNLAPQVIEPFEKLKAPAAYKITNGVKIVSKWPGLENSYKKTKRISFDYAIAENCKNSIMVYANFDWIDIGNWEEYAKIYNKKETDIFNADGDSCYVDSDIPVALAGVEDLIVVIRSGKEGSPACALITRKGQTQKVRDIIELIKKSKRIDLL
ncbi:MAG: mannose-1-phosphate guanylyltransferase [Treponema sp.]|jgi:mannose-1-phosphate guanylyltransferase/mannose-1-phosphate guanylyltransferase/mannose-6-phosphate isomerase|nr:mannose-1-phosphate guanylyltransferase [Treponema sp.]